MPCQPCLRFPFPLPASRFPRPGPAAPSSSQGGNEKTLLLPQKVLGCAHTFREGFLLHEREGYMFAERGAQTMSVCCLLGRCCHFGSVRPRKESQQSRVFLVGFFFRVIFWVIFGGFWFCHSSSIGVCLLKINKCIPTDTNLSR